MASWLLNIAIAIDQLLNTLLAGQPDETLSSRAHRMRVKGQRWWGWTANAVDLLFFWQSGHCEAAYQSELDRTQLPPEMRRL
ncbi:MAG: pseudouridine synthase [Desulfovibrionaceae bacterium]|jgi:hypothetical protein|nr:pseudouridine synthase [Desulfovibrionaceae bacterium]